MLRWCEIDTAPIACGRGSCVSPEAAALRARGSMNIRVVRGCHSSLPSVMKRHDAILLVTDDSYREFRYIVTMSQSRNKPGLVDSGEEWSSTSA